MNIYRLFSLVILFVMGLNCGEAYSQLVINMNLSPDQLVQSLVGPGISVSNVTYDGNGNAMGAFSQGNSTNLGMEDGVALSSGNVTGIPNPSSWMLSYNNGYPGDPELSSLAGLSTKDAAVLEFDFIPAGDTIFIKFIFSSEDYPEYIASGFYDPLGIFITGPEPGGSQYLSENIALVPGTQEPVSVNTINHQVNPQYYVDNTTGTSIAFDGFTTVLKAELLLVPFENYHIKIAIADALDQVYDSGVFLGANSFMSSNSYFPLVENDKEWSILSVGYGIPPNFWDSTYYTYQYKLEGDTVISELDYKKVYKRSESIIPEWFYYCAIREDEDKNVFMESQGEKLVYNFGLEVGDTIVTKSGALAELYVESIDSLLVDGFYRKRLFLRYVVDPQLTEYWIEGIGSNRGLLETGTGLVVGGTYRYLCTHHMGELIYMHPDYTTCQMTNVSVPETETRKLSIYPNPADQIVIVQGEINALYEYNIYNISGQLLLFGKIPAGGSVELSSLQSGIYFMSLKSANDQVVMKLMKQ